MPLISTTKALEIIEHKASALRRIYPSAINSLDERRAQVGNKAAQENPTHNTDICDPTGQHAQQLADIELQREQLTNAVKLILRAFDHADHRTRRAFGRQDHDAAEHETCIGYQQTCDNLPGYDFEKDGTVVTRKNRLCDDCELSRERDERNSKRAQAERLRRHQPKNVA